MVILWSWSKSYWPEIPIPRDIMMEKLSKDFYQNEFQLEGAREQNGLNDTYIMIKNIFIQMHDNMSQYLQLSKGR